MIDKSQSQEAPEGFFRARVHQLSLKGCSVEEMATMIVSSVIVGGYILTEHPEFGSILISPDQEHVYIVPTLAMQYLIDKELIALNPTRHERTTH
jgi:hypothetical protein